MAVRAEVWGQMQGTFLSGSILSWPTQLLVKGHPLVVPAAVYQHARVGEGPWDTVLHRILYLLRLGLWLGSQHSEGCLPLLTLQSWRTHEYVVKDHHLLI